ncbi:regulatory protein RecX [Candidatus Thiodiazotropha sp. CDECU1]|uniref:regulatory protein RecX n=1 Tax=Candidatus Thiodiazotropha sp. CDECU1 TaxID=3065865 RepID=UPI00293164B9|nr:regulatory protein RecX [Candidatus Thiodiazotropha sp. CDECU1]
MQRKLHSRGFEEHDIETVLLRLRESDLQSDDRYTENYISSRMERGNGPIRIRAELHERGIDEALIETHLEGYAELWPSLLQRVHDAKFGSEPGTDRRLLAKKARFLENRGFPGELIRRFLFD